MIRKGSGSIDQTSRVGRMWRECQVFWELYRTIVLVGLGGAVSVAVMGGIGWPTVETQVVLLPFLVWLFPSLVVLAGPLYVLERRNTAPRYRLLYLWPLNRQPGLLIGLSLLAAVPPAIVFGWTEGLVFSMLVLLFFPSYILVMWAVRIVLVFVRCRETPMWGEMWIGGAFAFSIYCDMLPDNWVSVGVLLFLALISVGVIVRFDFYRLQYQNLLATQPGDTIWIPLTNR